MTEQDNKTVDDVLIKRLASIGIKINMDQESINKQLDPALAAITRKLKQLSKESELNKGVFGEGFFGKKIKDLTGFDLSLAKSVKTMIGYGLASKNMNLDNKEFYNSLSGVQKLLVKTASLWSKKGDAEKKAAEQSKKSKDDLNSVLSTAEGLNKSLEGGFANVAEGAEVAEAAVFSFETVATGGLALVAAAIIGVGAAFYKMFSAAISARDEVKKFDQLIGGMGEKGVTQFAKTLAGLNKELWTLGFSLEKVNGVALSFVSSGLNLSRSLDSGLVRSVLTLSGATGVATDEIAGLYSELLKTTKIDVKSLTLVGDMFVQFNQQVSKTRTLGQVSFATFKESIMSSANALAIATSKGKAFTDSMTRDLMSLSGLATTLSLSVSELNGLFEQAGSMVSSPDSPFRAFLALSGGANINQMLNNQFDKTTAMLKGITFLQELNKSFAGNIAATAQIAQLQLGVSKEVAIRMINTRQETINDMLKAQRQLATIQTDAAKEAFEKVNSGLLDKWERIKTMFVTMFQNIVGSSGGMQNLLRNIENLLGNFQVYMEKSGFMQRLGEFVEKTANWLADHVSPMITYISNMLNKFEKEGFWKGLMALIMDALRLPFYLLAKLAGEGFRAALGDGYWTNKLFGKRRSQKEIEAETANSQKPMWLGGSANNTLSQLNAPANNRISEIDRKQGELSKWNPETVTYGKMAGTGKVGFMTVGQKEYALELEKEKLQKRIADATEETVRVLKEKKQEDNKEGKKSNTADAAAFSPMAQKFALPEGYEGYANGR